MNRLNTSAGKQISDNWNAVFDALGAEPRRQIVTALLNVSAGEAVQLPAAADPSFWETDTESLSVALIHTHLPKLEQHDFVEWSRDPFVARRGPRFEEVAVVFASLYENVDRIPHRLVDGCPGLEEALERTLD
jgi:hypothetical protein